MSAGPSDDRPRLRLAQLPVPPPSPFAATGNVPLAAGCLGVAAAAGDSPAAVEVVGPEVTDALGDTLLADALAHDEPAFLGLSLYLWNAERSLHLARAVKRRSPATRIVVGGPEVSPDNPFVLRQAGFDVAVTGEAEALLSPLLARLAAGAAADDLPGVAERRGGGLGPFAPQGRVDFPLTRYPSPYLTGALPVDPDRAVYLESVRGCRSQCTFCFYPRSSNALRLLPVAATADLVARVRDRGAREVVFLDPTFNHRPDFDELLDALAAVNPDGRLAFFGEVRAEGLTPARAEKLARAGFHKVEIGLQSVKEATLRRVRRGGRAANVARAARLLQACGIDVLVDLIVGLPGDTPADVDAGVEFLLAHDLADDAQIFPLSLLPGTAMRADADAGVDGLAYEPSPPYRVTRTAWMDEGDLAACLERAEERLARDLDERPRPLLVAPGEGVDAPDVFVLDTDAADAAALARCARPGAAHAALWLAGGDLFGRRALVGRALDARLTVDPYATLDVVLHPTRPFPFDLLDLVRRTLAGATPSYLSRALAHRGVDLQRRLTVVLPADADFPPDFVAALQDEVAVFRDQSAAAAAVAAERLGGPLPGARVLDADVGSSAWSSLRSRATPEAVCFASRRLERAWVRTVLGHGETEADR